MRVGIAAGIIGSSLMAGSVWLAATNLAREMTRKETDVCMQRQIFDSCLATAKSSAPDSPPSIWSDVVKECRLAGFLMSKRAEEFVKPECRG